MSAVKLPYVRPLTVFLLAFSATTCGQPVAAPMLRIEAPLRSLVDVAGAASGRTVDDGLVFWRSIDLELAAKDPASLAYLRKWGEANDVVMVSVPTDSELASELARDPRVLAVLPSPTSGNTFALVPAGDPMLLEGIAVAAHNAGGHACGRLERLSFRAATLQPTLTAPLYVETARLASVAALTTKPSAAKIGTTIAALEAMGTRFYDSDSGRATPQKVKELFEAAAGTSLPGFSIRLVDHDNSDQRSVVVTLTGSEDPDTTVVLGAHLDSIVSRTNKDDPAPGADDDASGIGTLVEVVRVLAESGARFRRTVELHAYAAEEIGLVGSQEIANSYQDAGRKVAAMMQLDMNSYSQDGSSTIHLLTNDTSATLRRSAKDLLNTYLGGDFTEKTLGSGTSDHRSWARAGYPAVFPFEDPDAYNHALHTADDTSATINNLPMAARFGSLALAFIAHHAGLESARAEYEALQETLGDDLDKDLKLAIVASQTQDGYDVSVATAETVARVELCTTSEAGSPLCSAARVQTSADHLTAGRAFYASNTTMALAAGDRLAIFGYDADDKIVAQRTVRLDAK